MKKKVIVLLLILIFFVVGCEFNESIYEKDSDITKYALDKYAEQLILADVKFLKCYPKKDGTLKAVYTTKQRDNSFPATIRFDYINKSFNIYFDIAYFNSPKQELKDDIDECFECWTKLKDARKTWK